MRDLVRGEEGKRGGYSHIDMIPPDHAGIYFIFLIFLYVQIFLITLSHIILFTFLRERERERDTLDIGITRNPARMSVSLTTPP